MSWNTEGRAGREGANEVIMERIDSLREEAHHHLLPETEMRNQCLGRKTEDFYF